MANKKQSTQGGGGSGLGGLVSALGVFGLGTYALNEHLKVQPPAHPAHTQPADDGSIKPRKTVTEFVRPDGNAPAQLHAPKTRYVNELHNDPPSERGR